MGVIQIHSQKQKIKTRIGRQIFPMATYKMTLFLALVALSILVVQETSCTAVGGGSQNWRGSCACEVYQGFKTRTIRNNCKKGSSATRWWQIGWSCYCRCCDESVGFVEAAKSSADVVCSKWYS